MSGSWNSHVVVSGEHFEESKTPSDENACNTITVVKISDVNETEYAQGTRSKTLALPSNSREGVTPKCKESGNDSAREEESHVRDTLCYRNDVTDKHQSNALDVSVRLESGEFSGGGVQARTSFPDCSTSHDPSENLISRNSNTEQFTEKNDDVFPSSPPKSKSSSTDDLLDKNFVKWKNGGNSKRGGRGKDSTESESPSSDFEFSACSSVTSCTEDSGISSTVRDDELEEIPLNSSQFSPELYKQMSRFCVDNMVVSWVPQSSNTYAPCPNSNMKTVSSAEGRRSDESAQKHSKLKGLFSRSSQRQAVQGWKLFGKIPAKEFVCTNHEQQSRPSNFDRGDFKRKSSGDKPSMTTPTLRPKFLSMRKKPAVGSSTTALIFENRPSNLPAKSPTEEKKHRKQYEAMVAEARKKELKDMKLQERKQKEKCEQEDGIATAASVWISEILPNWETMRYHKRTRELWWRGLPPSVRGKVWKLAIGNDLHITHELFDIFQSHAYDKLFTTRLNKKKSPAESVAELPSSDDPVVSKAHTVELIMMDVLRTFPSLCIFQEGGPFHDVLHSILGAYTCYRPDVGYVQGMSFLAAVLLLNMEPTDAFICFANLLNKPCQLAFFRVDHPMMIAYFAAFEMFLEEFLPSIYYHFIEENFTPDMYLIDWTFTLFSKSLPLDVACRVWDVFCRDGEAFLFRAALGILKFYREDLLGMDFIHLGQFLSKLPEDIPVASLFQAIASINFAEQKFSQTLAMQKDIAPQIKSVTSPSK